MTYANPGGAQWKLLLAQEIRGFAAEGYSISLFETRILVFTSPYARLSTIVDDHRPHKDIYTNYSNDGVGSRE
jgi:hypothetical protein